MRLHPPARASATQKAFTFTALMVASALVTLVAASVISTQVFGLRMAQITEGKLGANAHARKLLSKIIDDAHAAQKWRLGQWSSNSFVEVSPNSPLTGNALMFYSDASNTNNFTRYYFDSTDGTLKRYGIISNASTTSILAYGVSNTVSFVAQDYKGATLTNKSSRAVIVVNIPFRQLQNPSLSIGTGYYYKSYTLRSKITLQVAE